MGFNKFFWIPIFTTWIFPRNILQHIQLARKVDFSRSFQYSWNYFYHIFVVCPTLFFVLYQLIFYSARFDVLYNNIIQCTPLHAQRIEDQSSISIGYSIKKLQKQNNFNYKNYIRSIFYNNFENWIFFLNTKWVEYLNDVISYYLLLKIYIYYFQFLLKTCNFSINYP